MRNWWKSRKEEPEKTPPVAPPPAEPEISLPDPQEARKALAQSKANKRRTDELAREVHEMLDFMRQAREENHFAEGLTEMIRKGR